MEIQRLAAKLKKPFFIASSFLITYGVIGAFVLPALLTSKIPEIIHQTTGKTARLAAVKVQPLPLAICLQGFGLQEPNGQQLATFDKLFIKIGLLQSFSQWALVIDEVALSQPFLAIAKQKNGKLNLQELLKHHSDGQQNPGATVFPVSIKKLSLSGGRLIWKDDSVSPSVVESIQPINLDIEDFTTHTNKQARLSASLTLQSGGHLGWQGVASLNPLSSAGHINLDKVRLETIFALSVADNLPFTVKGYGHLGADYTASHTKNGPKFTLSKASFGLHGFQLLEKGHAQALVTMPVFALQGIDLDLDKQTLVIGSLSANDADFQVSLNPQGILNYQRLFPNNDSHTQQAATVTAKPAPWQIEVNAVALSNFGVTFTDQTLGQPAPITLKPINVKLSRYTNGSGASLPFELSAVVNQTGSIKLAGAAVIQPFFAKAAIAAKDIKLDTFQPYLNQLAQLDVIDGKINADGQGVIATSKQGKLDISFKGNAGVVNLVVKDKPLNNQGNAKILMDIPAVAVRGIDFNLGNQELLLDAITATKADFQAWLKPDGTLNYQALFLAKKTNGNDASSHYSPTQAAPWKINIHTLALADMGLDFEDQTLTKPLAISFKPIDFKLSHYRNTSGGKMPVQLSVGLAKNGLITLKGDTVIEPLSAKLDLDAKNIDLEQLQAYFERFVRLDVIDGALNIDGKVSLAKAGQNKLVVAFKGNGGIANLLTRDQTLHKDFIKWDNLMLKNIDVDLLANRYSAASLLIDKPYARVTIKKDKTANFDGLVIVDGSKLPIANKTTSNKPAGPNKPQFKLGSIKITDGSSDFADMSLILPFAAQIKSLDGGASGISSEQKSTVSIDLKGTAYDLSPVDIKGTVSPYLGDYRMALSFYDMPMPLVSPYMVQFAGYKVEKGKLTLGLNYNVTNRELTASNSIQIDQFELGDKVDNPNAVSLPLKLAVALLKDSHGKIKIDVPLYGSMDDPKFSLGAIVTDALMNTLNKVITSPFNALRSLTGAGQEISTIGFLAGNSYLEQPQRIKLDTLSKALKERLALNIDIKGAAFQKQDWPVIREDALYEQLKKRRAKEINKEAETKIREEYVELSEDDYKRLLTDMFVEKFPQRVKKTFFGKFILVNPDEGEFYAVAKQHLFKIIQPEQERLKELASARARTIAKYFVKNGGIASERVYMLDTVIDPVWKNKAIVSTLSLNAND